MSNLNVTSINYSTPISKVNSTKTNKINFKANETKSNDTVEFSKKEMTVENKQKLIKSARSTATAWSILGGLFSTMYFGLRSDKTVAKKYDLDVNKDSDLIKQIKKTQTLWTLTSLLPLGGSIVGWIISENMNSKNIEIQ